ncbi:hydroxymethylglutaryl-coenzyme A reductase-domain-containing protein [Mycena crocata]|nr:hydroxymethylglutaryl-coenzyme A reductase-domain-containing protein [Mycena crocata]
MRTLLKPLAIHAAYSPIETIVFLSVVGTLAYLHVLNAIKHSAFFATPAPLRPAYALYTPKHEWRPVREAVWFRDDHSTIPRLDLLQVVFPLRDSHLEPQLDSLENVTAHIAAANPRGFAHLHKGRDAWTQTVQVADDFQVRLQSLPADSWGVAYEMETRGEAIAQMRSGRWVAHALRALVLRFYDLAKKTRTPDILLITAGYALMHLTFFLLVSRSRALNSSFPFALPVAILASSVLALLLALPPAMLLGIPLDAVALTEALPFLVCAVGFDKPLRLARAVFTHPRGLVASSSIRGTSAMRGSAPLPSGEVVLDALSATYYPIIRDYVLEIAVLLLGAFSRVVGLSEVCALAALILAMDCLMMCTFLAAVLCVMVEVRRIKAQTDTAVASSVASSISATTPSISTPATATSPSTAAASLNARSGGTSTSTAGNVPGKKINEGKAQENPVARLKLLLLVSFLGLHILTLTFSSSSFSSSYSSSSHTTPLDRGLLVLLSPADSSAPPHSPASFHPVSAILAEESGNDAKTGGAGKDNEEPRLLVRLRPPVTLRPIIGAATGTRRAGILDNALFTHRGESGSPVSLMPIDLASLSHRFDTISNSVDFLVNRIESVAHRIDTALTTWTALAGDPVLSKTLVCVLALSVLLNAFLLRGVGLVGVGRARPVGGVRFDVGDKNVEAKSAVVDGRMEEQGAREREAQQQDGWARDIASASASASASSLSVVQARRERERENETLPLELVHAQTPGAGVGVVPQLPRGSQFVQRVVHAPTFPLPPALSPLANASAPPLELADVDRRLLTSTRPRTRRSRTPARGRGRRAISFGGEDEVDADLDEGEGGREYEDDDNNAEEDEEEEEDREPRPLPELIALLERLPKAHGLRELGDEEVILLAQAGKIAGYALEKVLAPAQEAAGLERAVRIRRALVSRSSLTRTLEGSAVPFERYDYAKVLGACCENVVGYVPIPLGIAGPLTIDGVPFHIPMATAEGTLVASTSRGCKALNAGGGVTTVLTQDAMTRGPAIDFPSIVEAARAKAWIASPAGHAALKSAFESTSRFARLTSLKTAMAGRTLFVRFATATGDAMGMNMISKGTEKALEAMQEVFPEMVVLALSGNYCTDKKAAAVNWIEGRGKSVVAEAVVPGGVVRSVLKTTVEALCNLNTKKNLVGSAMAGSIGGFNAHASNICKSDRDFLATGQDPAQNVVSSNCMTLMEPTNDGQDLLITVSMPSIEVGTVGGGTVLGPQGAVLEMLGLRGAHPTKPGQNAQGLARVIAASVMAGELSLMSALAAGHLIRAHMVHNRSAPPTPVHHILSCRVLELRTQPITFLAHSFVPSQD